MKKRFISLVLLWVLAFASVANAQTPSPLVHTVQRGEYWYALARRYGVSLDVLLRVNPDLARHPKLFLFTGQQVVIPKALDETPSYTEPFWYLVQAGDTVASIAQRFEQYPFYIENANGVAGRSLNAGERLLIPAGPHAHYLQPGEGMAAIAAQYGLSPEYLTRLYPDASDWQRGNLIHIPIQYNQLLLPIVPDALGLPTPVLPSTVPIATVSTIELPTVTPQPTATLPATALPQPTLLTAIPTEAVLLANNLLATPTTQAPQTLATATLQPTALSQLAIQQVIIKQQVLRTSGDMVAVTIGVLPLGGQAPYVLLVDGVQVTAQNDGELVFEITAACGDGVATNFTVTVQDSIGQKVSATPVIPLYCLTR